ncbi:hypothetical protein DFR58_10488 [Anaerobacterium chartisolvens]|uniref:Uncharacterized protein n=1 Tax=Anaerobacterium chartisolvens TaxID=1297424 RepID=A0A369BBB3_9FIRM|nr:hypothetical protein [Anaerobacterium chartisolvens]RCX18819.1 hypothetical protein DFR58_10488 [Anaerobacterium chartisolvens]
MSKITNKFSSLDELVRHFSIFRMESAIEKRLRRDKHYTELEQKSIQLKQALSNALTSEQKALLEDYSCLTAEMQVTRERFIYKRGLADAFRIRDIILGAS